MHQLSYPDILGASFLASKASGTQPDEVACENPFSHTQKNHSYDFSGVVSFIDLPNLTACATCPTLETALYVLATRHIRNLILEFWIKFDSRDLVTPIFQNVV